MIDNFIRLINIPKMEMSYLESAELSFYMLMLVLPLIVAWGLLKYWVHNRRD